MNRLYFTIFGLFDILGPIISVSCLYDENLGPLDQYSYEEYLDKVFYKVTYLDGDILNYKAPYRVYVDSLLDHVMAFKLTNVEVAIPRTRLVRRIANTPRFKSTGCSVIPASWKDTYLKFSRFVYLKEIRPYLSNLDSLFPGYDFPNSLRRSIDHFIAVLRRGPIKGVHRRSYITNLFNTWMALYKSLHPEIFFLDSINYPNPPSWWYYDFDWRKCCTKKKLQEFEEYLEIENSEPYLKLSKEMAPTTILETVYGIPQ